MSELLQQLTRNCFSDRDATAVAQEQAAQWQSWLLPVTEDSPVGEDPGYHDDFLLMRDEMNKSTAQGLTLTQWESELLFEVKTRQLKLLRLRAHRHADKAALARKMGNLLGTLVVMDPARAAVLCDTQHKD